MPSRGLSLAERERLSTWPPEIARSDLATHFTLTRDDVRWLRAVRGPDQTVLALAVWWCAGVPRVPARGGGLPSGGARQPRRAAADTRDPGRLPRRGGRAGLDASTPPR